MEAQEDENGNSFGLCHTLVDPGESPFELLAHEEIRARVEEELRQVPEPFRTVVLLRDIEGLSYEEVEMVLIGNHAPFAWGKNGDKAVYNAAVLEEVARMAYLTEQINPQAPRLKEALINKHWQRKHGEGAYYGQS